MRIKIKDPIYVENKILEYHDLTRDILHQSWFLYKLQMVGCHYSCIIIEMFLKKELEAEFNKKTNTPLKILIDKAYKLKIIDDKTKETLLWIKDIRNSLSHGDFMITPMIGVEIYKNVTEIINKITKKRWKITNKEIKY